MTPVSFRVLIRPILVLVLAVTLPACSLFSSDSKREVPVKLNITIQAVADLNPDAKSRPSPMIVRVYELRSDATFSQADFFSLQNNDRATLSEDLLARDEFIVRPGDRRITISRTAHTQTGAIGVLAAYRNLPHSTWRTSFRFPPRTDAAWYHRLWSSSNTISLQVFLEDNVVRILDE